MHDESTLRIERGDGHGFTIRLGERHYTALLTADELEACRADAQAEIERLTRDLASGFPDNDLRSYTGWLFTPDYRRPDDLQGVFGWLFLFAVAAQLVRSGMSNRAVVAEDVPTWVDSRFEQVGIEICARKSSLRSRLRQARMVHAGWQAMRFLAVHLALCLRKRPRAAPTRGNDNRSVLVKMPLGGASTRYGSLESTLSQAEWQMVPQSFDDEEVGGRPGNGPTERWYLLPWTSISAVLAALGDAIRIKRRLTSLAGDISDAALAKSPAYDPSLYALARRMLQIRLWTEALSAGRPKAAVLVTSLTRPEDRMLIACLKRHGVPVCQVLPRPVNPDRPAEKLLDIDRAHADTLADLYIARDGQSRDELAKQGIEPRRVRIGVPEAAGPAQPGPAPVEGTRILLLLTVLEQANADLCRILADALENEPAIEVVVRCHPTRPLGDEERQALNRLPGGWREEPALPITAQVGPDTLAVTSTSTAAIEAARYGAAVVWAPFLSDIALFQQRFMRQLGKIANSESELTETLQALSAGQTARRRLAGECREAANNRFSATETIPKVVVEWLEGI